MLSQPITTPKEIASQNVVFLFLPVSSLKAGLEKRGQSLLTLAILLSVLFWLLGLFSYNAPLADTKNLENILDVLLGCPMLPRILISNTSCRAAMMLCHFRSLN